MTALLALLAVAGYQNRDKIAEMMRGATGGAPAPAGATPNAGGSGLGGLFGGLGAGGVGGMLSGGLQDIVDRFRQAGHGETADSWVSTGPNRPVQPQHLEQALGADTLDTIARQTGLSREEVLTRLTRNLPSAVDQYTPEGRIPT